MFEYVSPCYKLRGTRYDHCCMNARLRTRRRASRSHTRLLYAQAGLSDGPVRAHLSALAAPAGALGVAGERPGAADVAHGGRPASAAGDPSRGERARSPGLPLGPASDRAHGVRVAAASTQGVHPRQSTRRPEGGGRRRRINNMSHTLTPRGGGSYLYHSLSTAGHSCVPASYPFSYYWNDSTVDEGGQRHITKFVTTK